MGNDENGDVVAYSVDEWVNDWKEKDMLDDKIKYDSKYDEK